MNQCPSQKLDETSSSDDVKVPELSESEVMMRRFTIMCGLFETAYEIKSLELKRRHPTASEAWIHEETLRLIEAGTR